MATEYSWKEWSSEQSDSNVIKATDCERWQSGVQLFGGTWDGSWADGKDSITGEQLTELEQQIQTKVASYSAKTWADDNVPGVDGWNKVENGVLKAICMPDGINRNALPSSKEFDNSIYTGGSVLTGDDYNGFAIRSVTNSSGVQTEGISITRSTGIIVVDPDTDYTISFWAKGDTNLRCYLTSSSNVVESSISSQGKTMDADDGRTIVTPSDDWERYWVTWHTLSSIESDTGCWLYFGRLLAANTGTIYICGPKFEKGSATDWTPAPEDYGYPSSTSLSANPQSVEDGSDSEVAPGPVETE